MKNKSFALITGASGGIGEEIARILADRGYSLVIVARRMEKLEALKNELQEKFKIDVITFQVDLSQSGSAQGLFEKTQELGINVEILVNNAGVGLQGEFIELGMEQMMKVAHLNITSLVELSHLFAKNMIGAMHAHGRDAMHRVSTVHIMNVSSMAAFLPTPYVSMYAATKSFVMSFSEALRFELKETGVSVTTLYPGITSTAFEETAGAKSPGLMAKISVLSATKVAEAGVRGMFKKKKSVIPGFINKISSFFIKVLPRGLVVTLTGKMMKKANEKA